MPMPDIGPSLARFRATENRVVLEALIPLRAGNGSALSGLPAGMSTGFEIEPVFDLRGIPLVCNAPGADTEGIAARCDGRFWIAEEYGPSLLLVNEDGVVEQRIVPLGAAGIYDGSPIPVIERLPAIALARKLNRGFEALALSNDGSTLFVAFQSPLAHPDRAAHEAGDIVRIWALDAESAEFIAEFAYPLDPPDSFLRDVQAGPVRLDDVKVSELAIDSDGSLLVLERVTLSTHIYRVRPDPGHALPERYLDRGHRPTLEQLRKSELVEAGVASLEKKLVLSTDQYPQICGDLEGMLVEQDGSLLLSNDNDFGIEGAMTQFWRVRI